MPSTLTLDLGLDFARRLPGEAARFERNANPEREPEPAVEMVPTPTDPPLAGASAGRDARRGLTLDEVIVGVWEGLHAHHTATCPICGGEMLARHGSGPRPVGGRCVDCGTTMS